MKKASFFSRSTEKLMKLSISSNV